MTSETADRSRVDHAVEKAVGRIRTLGEQTAFYGQALWNTPDAIRRYPTMVLRQIAGMGGDVSGFVPAPVAARLKKRFAGKPGI